MTEDVLRRSLEAEAEDVVAGPDLEARIRAAVTGETARRRLRRRTLLAAAAALVVAGGIAAVLADRGPETNDFQTAPPSSPGTATDSTPSVPAEAAPMPGLVALVTGDGRLATLDLATGGDAAFTLVDGPVEVNGVDLSPDGQWVYFSTCCEQDVGATWRVPVAGGTPAQVGNIIGDHPRVSPDGRWVAAAAGQHVVVVPSDGGGGNGVRIAFMVDGTASDLAWSPDGTRLAFTERGVESEPTVRVLRFDGRNLVPDEDHPPQDGRFALWRPDGGLEVLAGGPLVDSIVSLSQNAAYTWILVLDQNGTLSGHQRPGPTELTIGDIQDAIAADW